MEQSMPSPLHTAPFTPGASTAQSEARPASPSPDSTVESPAVTRLLGHQSLTTPARSFSHSLRHRIRSTSAVGQDLAPSLGFIWQLLTSRHAWKRHGFLSKD